MDSLEREFEEATSKRQLPGVIIAAANKDDTFNYIRSFGAVGLEEGSDPVSNNSTMCLASATKLVTCVAAMQCVERGLLKLTDDISLLLPEWKDALILKGFSKNEGGKPILEKAQNTITLRHLLSHTSGITGLENEEMMEYYGAIGNHRATLIQRYFMTDDPDVKKQALGEVRKVLGTLLTEPLLFEPGTNWEYGQSTDWAGQLIERVTHLTLEQYCQENIFKPLSMNSTTFRLLNHPHIAANLMKMTSRTRIGTLENVESIYPVDPEVDLGGSNLYTSAPDFLALLKSLLCNDGQVLRRETTNLMFDSRLPNTPAFTKFKTDGDAKYHYGGLMVEGMTVDYCFAGLVNNSDLPGGRKSGSITWSGATGCFWWIDRNAGICAFYGSQMQSMNDNGTSRGMLEKFELALYANISRST